TFALHPALLDAALHALAAGGLVSLDDGPVLPFAWSGVALQAAGAAMVRVKLSRTGNGSVTLAVADGAGDPVASVESLSLRAVSAEQLRGAGDGDRLFGLEWTPFTLPAASDSDALVIESFTDFDALREPEPKPEPETETDGAQAPDVVAVPCPTGAGEDTAARVREVTHAVLELVQWWLAEERPARLALVTRPGD
ncbi:polyketide synthase, partial [Streptomyces sp. AA8]